MDSYTTRKRPRAFGASSSERPCRPTHGTPRCLRLVVFLLCNPCSLPSSALAFSTNTPKETTVRKIRAGILDISSSSSARRINGEQQGPFESVDPSSSSSSSDSSAASSKGFKAPQHQRVIVKANHERKQPTSGRRRPPRPTPSAAFRFNQRLQSLLLQQCPPNRKKTPSRTKDNASTSLAEKAERLLLQRVHEYGERAVESSELPYDTRSFNLVMQAWARQHSWIAAQRADALLRILQQHESLQADDYSIAAVLHAYAKADERGMEAAQRAQQILDQTCSSGSNKNSLHLNQTDVLHNAVMNAWAVSGHPESGLKAIRLLRQLERRRSESGSGPTIVSYNACFKALARQGQAREAQALLEDIQKGQDGTKSAVQPDKISYSTVMNSWTKSTVVDPQEAAKKVDLLLKQLEDAWKDAVQSDDKYLANRLKPDIVVYTTVLTAYAKAGWSTTGFLERMKDNVATPNAAFWNAWIHGLVQTTTQKSLAVDAGPAAMQVLRNLWLQFNDTQKMDLRPCVITYTAVIRVVSQAGTEAAAQQAMDLLDELQQEWERTGDDAFMPNTKTFTAVLQAWAKSGSDTSYENALRLLDRLADLHSRTGQDALRPNLFVFAQVFQLLAASNHNDAAVRAKDVLHQMHELHLAGYADACPDAATYAHLINAFTKSGVENVAELATTIVDQVEEGYRLGKGELKPTALLYSAALQAYAKSGSKEGADLAEGLLRRTLQMFKEGKIYAKPTALYYNAAMDAHARSGGGRVAAERAEALLAELEARSVAGDATLQPTTRSYNAVILAWKNSGAPEAPLKAEVLLECMQERSSCEPDLVTYNSIIGVWAKSRQADAADRASWYLNFLEESTYLVPDSFSYNSCLDALARNPQKRSAEQALLVYQRMLARFNAGQRNCQPDAITYTSLRRAWQKYPNRKRASMELAELDRLQAQLRSSSALKRREVRPHCG